MLQCLEWEPSGSFYQKRPVELYQNGVLNDHSGTSGLIDINLAMDMTDPTLPPNPRKAILYRPSVTHLIAVSVKFNKCWIYCMLHCSISWTQLVCCFYNKNDSIVLAMLLALAVICLHIQLLGITSFPYGEVFGSIKTCMKSSSAQSMKCEWHALTNTPFDTHIMLFAPLPINLYISRFNLELNTY